MAPVIVQSPNLQEDDECLLSVFEDADTVVTKTGAGGFCVSPIKRLYAMRTMKRVQKTGLMLIGLGGNNGSTAVAGILANRRKVSWHTKEGSCSANYFGSVTQSSTMRLGRDPDGREVFVPVTDLVPLLNPNDLFVSGWDISGMRLGDAMRRAKVLDYDLQRQLYDEMQSLPPPLPAVHFDGFVAKNQSERADNVLKGSKAEQLEAVRAHIREYKEANGLDTVIVLWTANTERCTETLEGVHDTEENLLEAIRTGHPEIAPSTIYCVAAILEGCSYVNGSPQNTFCPGILAMAMSRGVFLVGDDFKSGQTKFKSVLVDALVGAGVKPRSIVSYNHLGNNDGRNLSAPECFRSKEVSKSNVVDDMVSSNSLLYDVEGGESPDHAVVIKYVPFVGDSKRAMDEFTSEIFMGGRNTIVVHNTCEDSLLAVPLLIDLAVVTEFASRIEIGRAPERETATAGVAGDGGGGFVFEKMHSCLSLASYLTKAPYVPPGRPVVNALFRQRECILNFLRAAAGLPPDSFLLFEDRLREPLTSVQLPPTCTLPAVPSTSPCSGSAPSSAPPFVACSPASCETRWPGRNANCPARERPEREAGCEFVEFPREKKTTTQTPSWLGHAGVEKGEGGEALLGGACGSLAESQATTAAEVPSS
uniref:inositol-3-phosphate synthase n=1 Tax=Chromera velia CCMP2878 TaxID=1169474 RepID=A0A0G4G316_9ALVE|eukprot:Cvel_20014.t1-p1 / transcript=Cvel_20014.t1 / gene=Cvel_20014 / organism=Chromera_velia_CCMP2878 / gene_product=Inositol-3-phosphate synthase 1, putative / transcript_product=Inositol-3-phosphate synthase 1, putative / location=Cvel_scaffold1765:27657-31509(-) / protein_length=646 / sequence_SO=supercontig / SO=protein_coding / is_pseudo=false